MKRLENPKWKSSRHRKRMFAVGISSGVFALLALAGMAYVLGRFVPSQTKVRAEGNQIFVRKGDDFQAALNKANSGDTILLEAGATFKGSFVLQNKIGEDFITIRTSAKDSRLPAPDRRIDPEKYGSLLPKLESNVKGSPVILATNGAHHYRFIGVEFMPTIEGLYNIIQLGTSEETSIEQLPHHIEFDRVYIHGSKIEGQRRGIAANGRNIRVVNSYISDIKRKGDESQAIAVWSSDGPIEIINNYLEAAGMAVLFGGAGAPLELIPTKCVVKSNHMNKPIEWKGSDWVVKNMFEIKNGRDIVIENNLMTNNWAMGQSGTAIVFTTRADTSNATIEGVTFQNNIVRSSGNALNIYGPEGAGGKNLVIRNNLFDDIDGNRWGGGGHFMIGTQWEKLIIENNTIIQTGNITNIYGKPIRGFVFRNNIVSQNEYGFMGDGSSPGMNSIRTYLPQSTITNNVIVGSNAGAYGGSNFYPSSIRQIGFIDFKNYELRKESPFRSRGLNGKPIGAVLDLSEVGGK